MSGSAEEKEGKEYLIDDLEFIPGDISLDQLAGMDKSFTIGNTDEGNENAIDNDNWAMPATPLGEVFN